MRALEAEVPLGLAEQLGGERLAAVRAVDRERIAGGGRCLHPQPRLACCRESPAQDRPRLGRGCGRPHRRQARDGACDREPRAPLRGGAFRDRPRCRAPDSLRRRRRRPAGRPRPSLRARQGGAPRRARRGDVPRARLPADRRHGNLAARPGDGGRRCDLVRASRDLRGDPDRRQPRRRVPPRRPPVREPGVCRERASLRQRPGGLDRRAAGAPGRPGRVPGRRRHRSALRGRPRPCRGRAAHQPKRGRPHGQGAGERGRGGPRRHRGARARASRSGACECGAQRGVTSPTSSSAFLPAPPLGRATQPPTPSRMRSSVRCPAPTSSSTSSRPRPRSSASGLRRPLSACRACARSTMSPSSTSDDRTEVSLHLKLPGSLTLAEAHDVAEAVEREILAAVPVVDAVQTHIEPLGRARRRQPGAGRRPRVGVRGRPRHRPRHDGQRSA